MIIFGVCFVLYLIKLSAGKGFWTIKLKLSSSLQSRIFMPLQTWERLREASHTDFVHEKRHIDVFLKTSPP